MQNKQANSRQALKEFLKENHKPVKWEHMTET
jgi:hypothetical protein